MNTLQVLQQVGLSESEANVYLASLMLGPAGVQQLAQKSGLTRQMVYTLLPRLLEEGLLKHVTTGKKRQLQAVSPDILLDRAARLQKELARKVAVLKTQAAQGALPEITVYDSPLAMREWYRMFMAEVAAGEEMLIWATNEAWLSLDEEFLAQFLTVKRKQKVRDRVIAPDTPSSREAARAMIKLQPSMYRFTTNWWETPAEKWIWRDMVIHLTIRENATNMVVLRSEALAALERYSFEQAWQALPTTQ